jgi:hypothetical protein
VLRLIENESKTIVPESILNLKKWSEGSKMKGTSEEARTINSHLDELKNEVLDAERHFYLKKEKTDYSD